MKLTKEQIEYNKKEVIELLRSTKREGIEGLLKVMEEGGYYTAKVMLISEKQAFTPIESFKISFDSTFPHFYIINCNILLAKK